jgi:hypothetical protein
VWRCGKVDANTIDAEIVHMRKLPRISSATANNLEIARPGMIVSANNRKRRFEAWRARRSNSAWPNWMRSAPRSRPGSAKQERANDTRRKVLLGALVLHRLETASDEFSRALPDWLRRELPGFLTRDGDKDLFADLLANTCRAVRPDPCRDPLAGSQQSSGGTLREPGDVTRMGSAFKNMLRAAAMIRYGLSSPSGHSPFRAIWQRRVPNAPSVYPHRPARRRYGWPILALNDQSAMASWHRCALVMSRSGSSSRCLAPAHLFRLVTNPLILHFGDMDGDTHGSARFATRKEDCSPHPRRYRPADRPRRQDRKAPAL